MLAGHVIGCCVTQETRVQNAAAMTMRSTSAWPYPRWIEGWPTAVTEVVALSLQQVNTLIAPNSVK